MHHFHDNFRLHSLYYLPKNVRRRYFRDLSSGDINYKTLISRFLEKILNVVGGSIFSTYTLLHTIYIAITTIEPNATLDSFRGDWPHIHMQVNHYIVYTVRFVTFSMTEGCLPSWKKTGKSWRMKKIFFSQSHGMSWKLIVGVGRVLLWQLAV